uniref:Late embryogenesis abundant protein n=1 Tax=Caenorhabditis tropicalis TaxID=1561998 RepID=A0A1I7TSV0_9PELO
MSASKVPLITRVARSFGRFEMRRSSSLSTQHPHLRTLFVRGTKHCSASDGEDCSDDEFEALTAQRSFYIDAVCGEEDSPITDDGKLAEWAEKEARSLGLIKD